MALPSGTTNSTTITASSSTTASTNMKLIRRKGRGSLVRNKAFTWSKDELEKLNQLSLKPRNQVTPDIIDEIITDRKKPIKRKQRLTNTTATQRRCRQPQHNMSSYIFSPIHSTPSSPFHSHDEEDFNNMKNSEHNQPEQQSLFNSASLLQSMPSIIYSSSCSLSSSQSFPAVQRINSSSGNNYSNVCPMTATSGGIGASNSHINNNSDNDEQYCITTSLVDLSI